MWKKASILAVSALLLSARLAWADPNQDLIAAVEKGLVEKVQSLLDLGAQVSVKNKNGTPVLVLAAYYGHSPIVALLLDRGADIEGRSREGGTALCYAADNGHVETVKLLLERGADVNAKDQYGQTPLLLMDMRKPQIARLLLEAGADVTYRSPVSGATARFHALGFPEVELILRRAEATYGKTAASDTTERKPQGIPGVWLNSQYHESPLAAKLVYHEDATGDHYRGLFDQQPVAKFQYEIAKQWKDDLGRLYIQLIVKYAPNNVWYDLVRIREDGETLEATALGPNIPSFPADVNPKAAIYAIWYRE